MDSFFDSPPTAPEPFSIDKFIYKPSVPEVSMISNTKTSVDNFSTENVWKMKYQQLENPNVQQKFAPMGYTNLQTQFSRKQVRFESPVLQQKPSLDHTPYNKNTDCRNRPELGRSSAFEKQKLNYLRPNNPNSFENIYMANIPDRKLDLSLLDIPRVPNSSNMIDYKKEIDELSNKSDKKTKDEPKISTKSSIENKENYMPKTYQDFLELQKKMVGKNKESNDSVMDIFNYKRNHETNLDVKSNMLTNTPQQKSLESRHAPPTYQHYEPVKANLNLVRQRCDSETQTCTDVDIDSKALQNKRDFEPSNTDLLKIIAQQNEQLLLLQRQVAMLLERDKSYPKPIEESAENNIEYDPKKYNSASTPQNNHFRQENTITQQAGIFQDNHRKWGMSKFSINLTTSFEMPIRAQQKQNFVNYEPKIQEITESESLKPDKLEASFNLQEPLDVRELCPSPQPSININMNDYESSDDEELVSEIGATFYNNLMGQVNNMLKKAKLETNEITEDENKRSRMMNKVKEATLKHLKSIGINLKTIGEDLKPPEHESNKNYTPTEISCTVKQLLMKYLPSDQLKKQDKQVFSPQEPTTGIISPRPEFSMASLEYMRKYNLISTQGKVPDFIQPQNIAQKDTRRILDLTALKMQPKLL